MVVNVPRPFCFRSPAANALHEKHKGPDENHRRRTRLGNAGGRDDPVPVGPDQHPAADVAKTAAVALGEGVDADQFPSAIGRLFSSSLALP